MSPASTVSGALASAPGNPLLPLDKDLHGGRLLLPWNYFRFVRYTTGIGRDDAVGVIVEMGTSSTFSIQYSRGPQPLTMNEGKYLIDNRRPSPSDMPQA